MFTRAKLGKLNPETIFASGLDIDGEDGIYLWNTGELLRWVAVRGSVDDWAIYADKSNKPLEWIKAFGCKLTKNQARKLVVGDETFYNRYRI